MQINLNRSGIVFYIIVNGFPWEITRIGTTGDVDIIDLCEVVGIPTTTSHFNFNSFHQEAPFRAQIRRCHNGGQTDYVNSRKKKSANTDIVILETMTIEARKDP